MRPLHYKTEQMIDGIRDHIKTTKVLQVVTDYYGDQHVTTFPVHSLSAYEKYALAERRMRKFGLVGASVQLRFVQLDRVDLEPVVLVSYVVKSRKH